MLGLLATCSKYFKITVKQNAERSTVLYMTACRDKFDAGKATAFAPSILFYYGCFYVKALCW